MTVTTKTAWILDAELARADHELMGKHRTDECESFHDITPEGDSLARNLAQQILSVGSSFDNIYESA